MKPVGKDTQIVTRTGVKGLLKKIFRQMIEMQGIISVVKSTAGENGDPEAIRTPDRLLRRQMLYPAELRDQRAQK